MRGLGLGLSATTGRHAGTRAAPGLPSFKTSGQLTFFGYLAGSSTADTVVADGTRRRVSPQASYTYGPVGALAEYVSSTQEVRKGAATASLTHRAWQVAATYVLFGGEASLEGVKPARPFKPRAPRPRGETGQSNGLPGSDGWGALELVGRVSRLSVDAGTFPLFADPAAAARTARSWSVGLGWSVNAAVKLLADYERTTFEGGGHTADRDPEELLATRLQVAW